MTDWQHAHLSSARPSWCKIQPCSCRDLPVFGEGNTKAPTRGLGAADTLKSMAVAPKLVIVIVWVLEAVLVKVAPAKRTKGAKLSGVMLTLGAVLK